LGSPTTIYGLSATTLKPQYIGGGGRALPTEIQESPGLLSWPFWRQGFASEASRAFMDVGFERLRVPRLFAEVDNRNEVSIRILEKFGFRCASEEVIPAGGRIMCTYELLSAVG
jgi:hypothetical protein